MHRIDLSWTQLYANAAADVGGSQRGLPLHDMVLSRNTRWFVTLRWIAAGMLTVTLAVLTLLGERLISIGLVAPQPWAFAVPAAMALTNFAVAGHAARRLLSPTGKVWFQIFIDLIGLTFVVHFAGSIGTPAPFLFVLHIALACLFLDGNSSLAVTGLTAALYDACLAVEYGGIVPPTSLFAGQQGISPDHQAWHVLLQGLAMTSFLFLVWYVVSRFSKVVRVSEAMIVKAQKSARAAQQERSRHALQMTHQLKSPLDSVQSYMQLLVEDVGRHMTHKGHRLVKKIDAKLRAMRELVLDVLQLSRLEPEDKAESMSAADLGRLLKKCLRDMQPKAALRNVRFMSTIEDATVECYTTQIEVLLANLLSNAINYSHEGGTVKVALAVDPEAHRPTVVVSDSGIGIDAEKLPHIFEPYYRTKEAAQHNPNSTGVGLAIVNRIAQTHKIDISVESEMGKGTTFRLVFPEPSSALVAKGEDVREAAGPEGVTDAAAS